MSCWTWRSRAAQSAGTLEQQVKRMLADPKSEALVTNFASQWLYLRNLAAASPDARQFPDFDDNLRQALRRETELFFESIVTEDAARSTCSSANYTFVNERLAKHYGIPNVMAAVSGAALEATTGARRHPRPRQHPDGDVLCQPHFAGAPRQMDPREHRRHTAAAAAANVPLLQDTDARGVCSRCASAWRSTRAAGVRELSSLMDPAGLSMENFDAIGRWRTRTESGSAVDASGGLPDGSEFAA